MSPEERIKKAIEVIVQYGGIDGAHHKTWVLDQAIRCLTGCPEIEHWTPPMKHAFTGEIVTPRRYTEFGESEEYKALVAEACAGEDGPDTYSWDVGIAP